MTIHMIRPALVPMQINRLNSALFETECEVIEPSLVRNEYEPLITLVLECIAMSKYYSKITCAESNLYPILHSGIRAGVISFGVNRTLRQPTRSIIWCNQDYKTRARVQLSNFLTAIEKPLNPAFACYLITKEALHAARMLAISYNTFGTIEPPRVDLIRHKIMCYRLLKQYGYILNKQQFLLSSL